MKIPNKKHTLSIIKLVLTFITAFAATSLIPTEVITMEKYKLVIAFLLLASTSITYVFKKDLLPIISATKKREWFILIGLSLIIHAATSYLVLTYLDQPIWPFDSKGTSFLLMNNYYV